MIRFSWEQLAALRTTNPELGAFDHDLSEIPEGDRTSFLAHEFSTYDRSESPAQKACGHLGLVIDDKGVSLADAEVLTIVDAFDVTLHEDVIGEDDVTIGTLPAMLGYVDGKELGDDAWNIREIIDLVSAALDLPKAAAPDQIQRADIRERIRASGLFPMGIQLADQLASIGTGSIAQNSTDALDRIVGDWGAVESCTITPDRATATSDGRHVSVEGDLIAIRHSGERIETRVLVSADDLDDPHCAPVIEPFVGGAKNAAENADEEDSCAADQEYAWADWKDFESVVEQTKRLLAELGSDVNVDEIADRFEDDDADEAIPSFLKDLDGELRQHGLAVIMADADGDSYGWRIGAPVNLLVGEHFGTDLD